MYTMFIQYFNFNVILNILLCYHCVDVLPPTNVHATMVTSQSIQITYEPSPSNGVTGYLISYITDAQYVDNNERSRSATVSTTSYNLTNLEEDTLYAITIQATTDDNRMSTNTNEVSVRTYTDGK